MPVSHEPAAQVTTNGAPSPHNPSLKPPQKHDLAHIIDICRVKLERNLKDGILANFHPKDGGPRKLPTVLLYDEKGLQLFEKITYLPEYYLTNAEIRLLEHAANDIAATIPAGAMVIELGSGNLRKVNLILCALEQAQKDVDYYALDLSQSELTRTLTQLPPYRYVRCRGLLGTYDDGLEWLKGRAASARPKCVLTLGSSIGNFDKKEAADFIGAFRKVLSPRDQILVGVDGCCDPAKVYRAYNDSQGLTHKFILNGLAQANVILGEEVFHKNDWKVIGEYVYDASGGRHQAFVSPIRDACLLGAMVRAHERIEIEQSLKYTPEGAAELWTQAGFTPATITNTNVEKATDEHDGPVESHKQVQTWLRWTTEDGQHSIYRLTIPDLPFPLLPSLYARDPLPTLQDWSALWTAWDLVTQHMIRRERLLHRPITLRNPYIFYLGHIPTFLDIQLTKAAPPAANGATSTPPGHTYWRIFERGIDPDVNNPSQCHAHSETPNAWPAVTDILAYQDRVRDRVRRIYAPSPSAPKAGDGRLISLSPRRAQRALWVGFEHEAMHLETFLYMVVQDERARAPTASAGVGRPDFEALAQEAKRRAVGNEWFDVPAREVVVGMEDPKEGGVEGHGERHFGWDNEKPVRRQKVHAFQAKGRPITNGEYAKYLSSQSLDHTPASWMLISPSTADPSTPHCNSATTTTANNNSTSHSDNEHTEPPPAFLANKAVRTVYGPVPLRLALDWPVVGSYDELVGCAAWLGGRIPTAEEVHSLYAHADEERKRREIKAEMTLGRTVPAVNAHLCNDGVEETPPPSPPSIQGSPASHDQSVTTAATTSDLFADLSGANVGLHHWHPMPVTAAGGQLAGRAEIGGVWEWTSSELRAWEGFRPMEPYPRYTADFFDGKHNIVLGGSWATHPRIAGRKTFINWYQRNYRYVWAGARLVRDTELAQ